jgi:hypothetical protein
MYDDSGNGALQFTSASITALNNGSWAPSVGGMDLTPAPANNGFQVTVGGLVAYAAFRDFAFSVSTGGFLPLDASGHFDSTQTLTGTSGSADYNAGAFGSGNITVELSGGNQATTQGTLTNPGDGSFHVTVPIQFTLNNDNPPASLTFQGTIAADAHLPVLTLGAGTRDFATNFTTGGPAVNITDPNATVTSTGSQTLTSVSIRLANNLDGANELLTVDLSGTPGLTSTWTMNPDGSATLTITGSASVSDYQNVIRTVQYSNSSATPDHTDRVFQWTATDDQGNTSFTSFSTVSIQ